MKSNKSVTWTENTIFRERCANNRAHAGPFGSFNIPPGRWQSHIENSNFFFVHLDA